MSLISSGYRQLGALPFAAGFLNFFANNVVAQINAFVADEHRRTRNELPHLVLAFATERAIKQLAVVARGVLVCHKVLSAHHRLAATTLIRFRRFCKSPERRYACQSAAADDLVHNSVFNALHCAHKAVALGIALNHFHGLTGVLCQ